VARDWATAIGLPNSSLLWNVVDLVFLARVWCLFGAVLGKASLHHSVVALPCCAASLAQETWRGRSRRNAAVHQKEQPLDSLSLELPRSEDVPRQSVPIPVGGGRKLPVINTRQPILHLADSTAHAIWK